MESVMAADEIAIVHCHKEHIPTRERRPSDVTGVVSYQRIVRPSTKSEL